MEFAIFPTDSTESKSPFVAKVLDMIDRSGLEYRLTPMGTIIEAESVGEIFELIEKAYEILGEDSSRIYSVIKVDYRKGPDRALLGSHEDLIPEAALQKADNRL